MPDDNEKRQRRIDAGLIPFRGEHELEPRPPSVFDLFRDWYLLALRSVAKELATTPFEHVFGSLDRDEKVEFRFGSDAHVSYKYFGTVDRIGSESQKATPDELLRVPSGKRVGILVLYRPRGEGLVGLNGAKLQSSPELLAFEQERSRRFADAVSLMPAPSELAPTLFAIDANLLGLRTDIVVLGPQFFLKAAGLEERIGLPCLARLNAWKPISLAARGAFAEHGGDVMLMVALVSENWQARWVKENLDERVRLKLAEAEPAELAQSLTIERIAAIAESRLEAEDGQMDGSLPQSFEARLLRADGALQSLQQPIRSVLTRLIEDINSIPREQRRLPTLEENERLVSSLQRLLSEVGMRLCCPSCQSPGTFRCRAGNSPHGVFSFAHNKTESAGKRACGGWATIPDLKIL